MPEKKRRIILSRAPWRMHEFFAGSGMVAYGLQRMFCPVWANDNSSKKAEVYHANFIDNHFILDDISNVKGDMLPLAHLSWASFPCQDLSLAGNQGGINAERSGLIWEWLRILRETETRPAILVIENVIGLISAHHGEDYRQLHLALNDLGYNSGAIIINASHFVPQSRPRVFVIAVRHGEEIPQQLVDIGPNWLHNNKITDLSNGLPGWIWWRAKKPKRRSVQLKDILDKSLLFDRDDVIPLIPMNHRKLLDQAESIIATGYRRMRSGQQRLELRFDGIAGCLRTPEGGSSKQYLIVKQNNEIHARLFSPREYARLMGAPDSFWLPKNDTDGYKAMGDAVVLPVAKFIGCEFLVKLAEAIYGEQ